MGANAEAFDVEVAFATCVLAAVVSMLLWLAGEGDEPVLRLLVEVKQSLLIVVLLWLLLLLLLVLIGVLHHLKSGLAFIKASLCCLAKSVYLLFCSLSNLDHRSPRILVIPLFSKFGYFSLTSDLCLLQKSRNAFIGRFCSIFVCLGLFVEAVVDDCCCCGVGGCDCGCCCRSCSTFGSAATLFS